MATCNKCKQDRCGCADSALSVPTVFSNDPQVCPPNSETCSEVFDMACIRWMGPDVCELGISTGDKLSEVIQKIVLGIAEISCIGVMQGETGYGFTVADGAPSGAPTDNRIYYLDLSTGDMYEWNGTTWNLIGTLGGGAPLNETFVIISPAQEGGDNIDISLSGSAGSTGTGDTVFWADRVGCADDIVLTVTSTDGVTINGSTTQTILSTESNFISEWQWPVLGAGVYTWTLEWESCGVTRTQNYTLTLT